MSLTLKTPNNRALRQKTRELVNLAGKEMGAAIIKHPMFPDTFSIACDKDTIDRIVALLQRSNESEHAPAEQILHEEFYEFIQAVRQGDKPAAAKELAQIVQVCARIYYHLDHYIAQHPKKENAQ